MPYEVTTKTVALYNFILEYYAAQLRMPCIREMKVGIGVGSTNTIYRYLGILQAWGWISRPFYSAERAITLTRPTEAGLTPAQLQKLLVSA